MFTLSPTVLTTITGVLLPLLVGLVTKSAASSRTKTLANIVVSAVACLLLNAANESGYAVVSGAMLAAWLQQTAISVATYLGVWKPLQVPQHLAPAFGVGTVPVQAAPATRQGGTPLPKRPKPSA